MSTLFRAYLDAGRFSEAHDLLEEELAEARAAGDREREAAVIGHLGITFKHMGDYRRAVELQEDCLRRYQELGQVEEQGHALGDLGVALKGLGEFDRARRCFEEQLAIARRYGDSHSETSGRMNLANLLVATGDLDDALAIYQDLVPVVKGGPDRLREADVLLNLGNTLYLAGQAESAKQSHLEALEIFCCAGAPVREGYAAFSLALDHAALGELEAAIPLAERSRDLLEAAGAPGTGQARAALAAWAGGGEKNAEEAAVSPQRADLDRLIDAIDALGQQGEGRREPPLLLEAADRYRELLRRSDLEGSPRARVLNNLANALRIAGLLTSDPAAIEESIAVLGTLLGQHRRHQTAEDRRQTELNLAKALVLYGVMRSDARSFARASRLLRRQLRAVRGPEGSAQAASIEHVLGDALHGLGVHGRRKRALCAALGHHLAAWEAFAEGEELRGAASQAVWRDLQAVKSLLGERRSLRCFSRHGRALDRYLQATVGAPPSEGGA